MKQLALALMLFAVALPACRLNMTFTGADVGDAKTFSVEFFKVQTALASPILGQQFTEEFRDFVQNQSTVKLTDDQADLQYSGAITGYAVSPVSVTADETASENRLTITVKVKYENILEESKGFEKSFSGFADYPSTDILSSIEEDLTDEILEQLFQDIYNASLGNW